VKQDKDFSSVISKIKPSAPGAIYYGGEYPQAGPLSQQMKSQGLSVPLMGGDGIFDPKYIELAGATATGDLATSVGAPTESTEAGKKFLEQYKAAGYAEPAAAYGGYAYDAAKAIIEPLPRARSRTPRTSSPRVTPRSLALGKVSLMA
jgi:branched-chain amino acid transport system substrate-binding protein